MKALLIIVAIILIIVFVVAGPLITLWVLNTLFGLGIKYTFLTWLAALLFNSMIARTVYRGKT